MLVDRLERLGPAFRIQIARGNHAAIIFIQKIFRVGRPLHAPANDAHVDAPVCGDARFGAVAQPGRMNGSVAAAAAVVRKLRRLIWARAEFFMDQIGFRMISRVEVKRDRKVTPILTAPYS